jgi:hypothetical protein
VTRTLTVLAFVTLGSLSMWAQMPDLREMSGRPLPSGDLPAGTVSVRVVRQTLANNVPGQEVELAGGAEPRRARTDAAGRAVFDAVAGGMTYRASVTVEGERVASQPFTMPASGGIRLLLVAGLGAATSPPAAAAVGPLEFSGQSRLIVEPAEDIVEVFNLFELVNPGKAAVSPSSPLVFAVPPDALNTSVLEGSTGVAKVENGRVVVAGPIEPGTTDLHFAYRLRHDAGRVAITQPVPLALPQMTVIARRMSDLSITVAGEQARREVSMQGRTYTVVNTGAIPAGGSIVATATGLPAAARWPQTLALSLAAAIALAGLWFAVRAGDVSTTELEDLRASRAARFDELVTLERRRRNGVGSRDDSVRREALLSEIMELDLAIVSLTTLQPAPPASAEARGVAADSPQSV